MSFEEKWLYHFAKGISKEKLEKYVIDNGNYIWHIFSWELIEKEKYLVGEEARKYFDFVDKNDSVYYEPFEKNNIKELTSQMDSEYIDKFYEIYIVSDDWSWTYIKTHEGDNCGPYFYKIKE